MKRKRFAEEQIIRALKEYEGGRSTTDICHNLGVSTATFYVDARNMQVWKFLSFASSKSLNLRTGD